MTLADLLQPVLDFLEKRRIIVVVRDWEQGVRIRLGRVSKLLTSTNGLFGRGLHFGWFMLDEFYVDEVNLSIADTDSQTLVTKDGKVITISLTVAFKIYDLALLYKSIQDPEDSLTNRVMAICARQASKLKYEDIAELLPASTYLSAASQLHPWGVVVQDVDIVNCAPTRAIRLIQD